MGLIRIPEEAYRAVESGVFRRQGLEAAAPYIAHAAFHDLVERKPSRYIEAVDTAIHHFDFLAMIFLFWIVPDPAQWLVLLVFVLRLLSVLIDRYWWKRTRRMAGILRRRDVKDWM